MSARLRRHCIAVSSNGANDPMVERRHSIRNVKVSTCSEKNSSHMCRLLTGTPSASQSAQSATPDERRDSLSCRGTRDPYARSWCRARSWSAVIPCQPATVARFHMDDGFHTCPPRGATALVPVWEALHLYLPSREAVSEIAGYTFGLVLVVARVRADSET